ncbi:MAG: carbohydrate ABC transporter permease, partial [Eubacteriales bacterium]
YFDILGIFNFLGGGVTESIEILNFTSINLNNSYWPLALLSLTGLAYRNGLYIFMMRQFYRGVPDELEESAYLDGCGTMMTFFRIIIPLSIPMMITIFLFAFCWQWTDDFYTTVFFTSSGMKLMPDIIMTPKSLDTDFAAGDLYISAIRNTCGLMIILPLVIVYLFGQRYLVQGIERSGIVG